MPRFLDPSVAEANMIKRGLQPLVPYPGKSSLSWACRCLTCGMKVEPCYGNVMQRGRGCDKCGRKAGALKRRIPSADAIAVMRQAGVEPLEQFPGVDKPWKCMCLNPRCPGLWMGDPAEIRPRYSDAKIAARSACKYCARRAVRPERAIFHMVQRGVEPLAPFPGAAVPWSCRCLTCGVDDISPTYANVWLTGQGGCSWCGGRVRVPEEQARDEMLAAGARPLKPYPGVNERWRCVCLSEDCPGPEDRVIYPRLGWVRQGAQPCKWCAGVVIDADTARATMIERGGLEPLEPYPGVRARWRCRCLKAGHLVAPTLGSVNSRGSSCAECAQSGFKRDDPALLYLIEHPRLHAAKVGVCGTNTGRLSKHERYGWRRFQELQFSAGRVAEALEREVIAEWRSGGASPIRDGKATYDGWTETMLLEGTTIEKVWEDVLQLHRMVMLERYDQL